MPAQVRVVTGPKRSVRAARIDRLLHEGLGRATLIVPARHEARERTLAFVETFDLPGLWGRPILAFEDFVVDLLRGTPYEQVRAGRTAQHLLFTRAIASVEDAGRLGPYVEVARTNGFVNHAQRIIGQLKQAAITPEEFESKVVSGARSNAIDAVIGHIYGAYQALLKEAGLYDLQGMYWMADLYCQGETPQSLRETATLLVDGFDDFTPSEFRLVQTLRDHVDELVIGIRHDATPNRRDLYIAPARAVDGLRDAFDITPEAFEETEAETFTDFAARHLFWRDPPPQPVGLRRNLHLVRYHNAHQELESIGRSIKTLMRAGETRPGEIGIVARDLSGISEELTSIFAEFGVPLSTPQAQRLDQSSVAQLLGQLYDGLQRWERGPIESIFANPMFHRDSDAARFFPGLIRAAGISHGRESWFGRCERLVGILADDNARIWAGLRGDRGVVRIAAEALVSLVQRLVTIDEELPKLASIEEHAVALSGWVEARIADAESERVRDEAGAVQGVLAALVDYGHGSTISRQDFAARFRNLLAEQEAPQAGTRGGVVCIDLASARYWTFRHAFLVGVNEGTLPARAPRNAVYSGADLARLDEAGIALDTASRHRDRERLLFHHLFESVTGELTISWHDVSANGQVRSPSPFIADVAELLPDTIIADESTGDVPTPERIACVRDLRNASQLLQLDLDGHDLPYIRTASMIEAARRSEHAFDEFDGALRAPDLLERLTMGFGEEHVFSPTQIEAYIACPMQFFMTRVLNAVEVDGDRDGLDPRLRGRLMHRILESFHRHFDATPWDEIDATKSFAILSAIVDDVFDARPAEYGPGVWAIEKGRMSEQLQRYAAIESTRGDAPWRPVEFEWAFGMDGEVPCIVDTSAGAVQFSGIVDRIDDLEGERRIIDYKNSLAVRKMDIDAGTAVQLMIYAWALDAASPDSNCRAAWYVQPGSENRREALDRGKEDVWEERQDRVRETIAASVEGMRSGRFHPTTESKSCRFCPVGKICRYEEGRIARKNTAS